MTVQEKTLLKSWITCEELRRAQDVENAVSSAITHPTSLRCRRAAEVCAAYEAFQDFARKLDALLHLFP